MYTYSVNEDELEILSDVEFVGRLKKNITIEGWRIGLLTIVKTKSQENRLIAVVLHDEKKEVCFLGCNINNSFASFSNEIPSLQLFEREIYENYGITPINHPQLRTVRNKLQEKPSHEIFGEGVHQVSVGPVHAGVIEPGHFLFQCHGEEVLELEISLGYQHRGILKLLKGDGGVKDRKVIETVAGDTSVAHLLSYLLLLENLEGVEISKKDLYWRQIALELERLANHVGDLGALSQDIGFMPTSAFCGRIRGDFLNMSALLCGSRFGRNFLKKGGTIPHLEKKDILELKKRVLTGFKEAKGAIDLLWENTLVLERFEGCGKIDIQHVKDLGIVGVAAKAAGIERDVRKTFSCDLYPDYLNVSQNSGDVWARAFVRYLEVESSASMILNRLQKLEQLNDNAPSEKIAGIKKTNRYAISLVEGWRGEVLHFIHQNEEGKLLDYKIRDPSFMNWIGLEIAMRGGQISDFPLCNKSFNLSYCGHDL